MKNYQLTLQLNEDLPKDQVLDLHPKKTNDNIFTVFEEILAEEKFRRRYSIDDNGGGYEGL